MILIDLPWLEPVEAAARLARLPHLAFLDSAMAHSALGRWSYVAAAPAGVFTVAEGQAHWNGAALDDAPLAALRRLLAERRVGAPPEGAPPFRGGAIGFLSYEAGALFERMPSTRRSLWPQMMFGLYDAVLAFDVVDRRAMLVASDDGAGARLRDALDRAAPPAPPLPRLRWTDSRTRSAYEAEVARVIRHIRDGDIFQANLSHRFAAVPDGPLDAMAAYRALRTANPAPFAALLVDGPRFLASSSPERFFRVAGGAVEARPIKGTIRREATPEADAQAAHDLAASGKDRAENVMIVDLLRNDLSKVCLPGSVGVPVLCGVESYAGLHHLTSVVTGRLAPGRDALDVLAAAFPGGSITGAPKVRAMEIIAALEEAPRGVYCGAIGWIGADGEADFNIAIRTLAHDGHEASFGVGGGVTLLSDPASEYEETLVKAARLLAAFGGLGAEAAA